MHKTLSSSQLKEMFDKANNDDDPYNDREEHENTNEEQEQNHKDIQLEMKEDKEDKELSAEVIENYFV